MNGGRRSRRPSLGDAVRGTVRAALTAARLIPQPDLVTRVVPTFPAPDDVRPGELVLVRDGALAKWACLRCPSGCGEIINLPLASDRRPRWHARVDRLGRPSLDPSVRQLAGCRAHFWVRRGAVVWCRDA